MSKPRFTPAYPAELRERGVRLFRENRGDYASDTAAYRAIARDAWLFARQPARLVPAGRT